MTERDFIGYGKTPPVVRWPNGAQIAISVVPPPISIRATPISFSSNDKTEADDAIGCKVI